MTTDQERAELLEIRTLAEMLPERFTLGASASGNSVLLAPAIDGVGHEELAVLSQTITHWQRRALLNAPAHLRFLLGLVHRCAGRVKTLEAELNRFRPPPARQKDYAAEAAMKCETKAFRRYLIDAHGLPDMADAERTNTRLRTLLMIESRGELNTDPAAQARWKSLKRDFEAWLKR